MPGIRSDSLGPSLRSPAEPFPHLLSEPAELFPERTGVFRKLPPRAAEPHHRYLLQGESPNCPSRETASGACS